MHAQRTELGVLDDVVRILQEGRITTTYKYALLLALVELCAEGAEARGGSDPTSMGTTLTTRQIAEKVVALYYPQVRPYGESLLRQGRLNQVEGFGAGILRDVRDYLNEMDESGRTHGVIRTRGTWREPYEALVDKVETILIKQPLPRLQLFPGFAGEAVLYEIGWGAEKMPAGVPFYQRQLRHARLDKPMPKPRKPRKGETSGEFDNRVYLLPGVAHAFQRLQGPLQAYIRQAWLQAVISMNGSLEESRLQHFLFECERGAIELYRPLLRDLQKGECFYCGGKVAGKKGGHIDHVLPHAMHHNDDVANLVLSHGECNLSKSSHYASAAHVEKWLTRNADHRQAMQKFAEDKGKSAGLSTLQGLGRNVYLTSLTHRHMLWKKGKEFERYERSEFEGLWTQGAER